MRKSLPLAYAPLLAFNLLFAVLPRAEGQALTNPLTAEEVACNERQLAKLLDRITVGDLIARYYQLTKTMLLTYSNSHGFFEGLALTNQVWRLSPFDVPPFPPPPEHYLAFNLNPSLRTLLLNPERPMLGQVSLNREQSSSNFITPGGYYDITVKLDPTLTGSPRPDELEINNFEVPGPAMPFNGFLANSTKPGRGLDQDGILTSCHDRFTDFDRHVFAILERIFRPSTTSYTIFMGLDNKVAIFRGEEPNVFRINFYPIDAYDPAIPDPIDSGQVALEMVISWTPEGKLTAATVRGLPLCLGEGRLGCTLSQASTVARLIAPVLGGSGDVTLFKTVFAYDPQSSPTFLPPTTVNLEELLANTTWNNGFR